MDNTLKFNEDGTFKILQFTDVHWHDGSDSDLKTTALMETILHSEKPDLVIFTGDTVYTKDKEILRKALAPVNNAGVKWAFIFGNHDAEFGLTKEEIFSTTQEFNLCLTRAPYLRTMDSYDYFLQINSNTNKNIKWLLYLMDSGDYNTNSKVGGYDFIKRKQIQWYHDIAYNCERNYGNIPSLLFIHIPLPEYNDVWKHSTCYGNKNEDVCCPKQNSGLFSAMLEVGTTKGVFAGHDHINDYFGELFGIKLCYGRATGYNTYGKDGFSRGARVILLEEGNDDFKTWIRLDNGEVITNPTIHEPEK